MLIADNRACRIVFLIMEGLNLKSQSPLREIMQLFP